MNTVKKRNPLRNILFALSFIAKHTPLYFGLKILQSLFTAVKGFIESVLAIKIILDIIEHGRSFDNVLWFILFYFVMIVLLNVFDRYVVEYITPRGREKLNASMNEILHAKAAGLDLSCYDTTDFYNDFVWCISKANPKMNDMFDRIVDIIGRIMTVLLTGAFFISVNWVGLVFVIVYVIVGMMLGKVITRLQLALDSKLLPKVRERDYINRVFYLSDYAKEIRMFRLAKRLKRDFYRLNAEIRSSMRKYNTKITVLMFLNDYVLGTLFMRGLYLVYLIYMKIIRQSIGFGDIVALFNASIRLFFTIKGISEQIPQLLTDSMYIDRLRKFLDYEAAVTSGNRSVPQQPCTIEFVNVSFAYHDKLVLRNVSMTITPGEKVAIVGYNGAGKTTLVKLLMRLYDPTEGKILLDGVDIKEYNLEQYRQAIGAVFQDFQVFAASLYDNVVMDTAEECQFDVKKALVQSGFDKIMPLETPLTREFMDNGVNLSGGESQKVAIARVFHRSANYMIFDEPSSALDPISEYNIYQAMRIASAGKTVIFISHRLSSTRIADKIYMFEKGHIIESADHVTLMRRNGRYAEMFRMQAEKYSRSFESIY